MGGGVGVGAAAVFASDHDNLITVTLFFFPPISRAPLFYDIL
jgi:hypothetical protein